MASASAPRMSREDRRKAKELEELRKTGAAPPELDEDGQMINPHIPEYISRAPWYLNNNRPGLKHQRMSNFGITQEKPSIDHWYQRGLRGEKASTYRKGACENCGASTHARKDCMERPRKRGAKFTNEDIQADEVIQQVDLDFDGKRDRWNGYNPAEYKKVVEMFERAEQERRRRKEQELEEEYARKAREEQQQQQQQQQEQQPEPQGGVETAAGMSPNLKKRSRDTSDTSEPGAAPGSSPVSAPSEPGERKRKRQKRNGAGADAADDVDAEAVADADRPLLDSDLDSDTDDDEDLGGNSDDEQYRDTGRVMQSRKADAKFTTNQTTYRDLRIREDTAKYLLNLDVNSAHYDPKTHSMRENPTPNNPNAIFRGDNATRTSGDVKTVMHLQRFAWDAAARGKDLHALATPSQAEELFKQFAEKKAALKDSKQSSVLAKYGGQDHLRTPDRALLLGESEAYVEYDEAGRIVRGSELAVPRTKYEEDVHPGNHSSVWGSWYDREAGRWGFACCRATSHNAWCTAANKVQLELAMVAVGKPASALPPAAAANPAVPPKQK